MHVDHYPWNDAMLSIPPPVVSPSRFVKRGPYMVCQSCSLEAHYCRCADKPPADVSRPTDGGESSLEARVRAHKGGR